MSYNNYYRTIVSNEFLGISKELSAPSRYELDVKVENQKRIWDERVKRELAKQNKEYGLKDKKLEQLLGRMLVKQIGNSDKVTKNLEETFKGNKEEIFDRIVPTTG